MNKATLDGLVFRASEEHLARWPDDTLVIVSAWLDCEQSPIAGAHLYWPARSEPLVLSGIEVREDHRGHRLGARLMGEVIARYGTVYRTGTFSRSGYAASKHLALPYQTDWSKPVDPLTGRRPDKTPVVMDVEDFRFVDWDSGTFLN